MYQQARLERIVGALEQLGAGLSEFGEGCEALAEAVSRATRAGAVTPEVGTELAASMSDAQQATRCFRTLLELVGVELAQLRQEAAERADDGDPQRMTVANWPSAGAL